MAVEEMMAEGSYGSVMKQKPGASGRVQGRKVWQINQLMLDFHMNVLGGCETWVD